MKLMNKNLISNQRKRVLSGWLHSNINEFTPLQLQKFLFFYEVTSKIDDNEADFSYLKGYENGPVFSTVYGDYTYRRDEFFQGIKEAYEFQPELVDDKKARFSGFLVNILNEEELSLFTHELNIWKTKEREIMSGQKQVSLEESDLSDDDIDMINILRDAYTDEYIKSVKIIDLDNKKFIINNEDTLRLSEEHEGTLLELSKNDELENPIYISISEDGVLLID